MPRTSCYPRDVDAYFIPERAMHKIREPKTTRASSSSFFFLRVSSPRLGHIIIKIYVYGVIHPQTTSVYPTKFNNYYYFAYKFYSKPKVFISPFDPAPIRAFRSTGRTKRINYIICIIYNTDDISECELIKRLNDLRNIENN